MPVATSVVATGAKGVVVRKHLTTSTIPDDVAAVPGVVAGNTEHGAFPAYSTDPTAQDFAGLAVTPLAPGPSDILAPGLQDFTFGADFRTRPALARGQPLRMTRATMVQRGLTGDDQYKIQVDPTPVARSSAVSCRRRNTDRLHGDQQDQCRRRRSGTAPDARGPWSTVLTRWS